MSLKHDIEEYPHMWSEEIVAALEDYKNGERNSERKLRKFVDREISEYYYNELIKRHGFIHRINKAKKDRKRKQKKKSVLCSILAVVVLLSSTESSLDYLLENYSAESAVFFLFLYLWAIFYAFASDPNSEQSAELERENKILKEKIKNYERSDADET